MSESDAQFRPVKPIKFSLADLEAASLPTPSADEEIEQIIDSYYPSTERTREKDAMRSALIKQRALLSASHANEREELNRLANREVKALEIKYADASRRADELDELQGKFYAETLELRSTVAAREGEIGRIRGQLLSHERMAAAGVYVETEKYSGMVVQISTLQAELETSNKTIQALQEELEYCPTCDSLRSQLTEAQSELQQKKDALFEAGFSTTKRILELDAQLTEAQKRFQDSTEWAMKTEAELTEAQAERDEFAHRWKEINRQLGVSQVQLSEANAKLAEAERDTKRLDWLEANPDKIKDSTWLNHNLGWLISFTHDETLGECKQALRQAVDKALTRIGQ